jgi:hypothetical protein
VRCLAYIAVVAIASLVCCGSAAAASLRLVGDFDQPVYVTSSPADPDRLLIAERKGKVFEVSGGVTRQIADLSGLVTCCESERGIASIAPAPDFQSSARFYVAYTGGVDAGGAVGDVHLDSFRPDPAAPGMLLREPILSLDHATWPNHNGGLLQFGPDGKLYFSLGDGGGAGDPEGDAQNIEVLFGKILRIEPRPGQSPPYTSPADNPFFGIAGRDEIWAYGLRNPWRFSFDRATAAMVIGDVGQDAFEEVDFAASTGNGTVPGAGANYGWNCREGFSTYPPAGCGPGAFTEPVFAYPHDDPGGGAAHGCSIIGGYVVRDPSLGDLEGRYLYADFCANEVRSLVLPTGGGIASGDRAEGLPVVKPTSFGEDSCGRIYVASSEGPVYRIEGATPAVCSRPAAGTVIPIRRSARPHLLLTAKRLRAGSPRFRLKARLTPCAGNAGRKVRLRSRGKGLAVKLLRRNCVARFGLRIDERTFLRAVVRLGRDGPRVRSRRLVITPPSAP